MANAACLLAFFLFTLAPQSCPEDYNFKILPAGYGWRLTHISNGQPAFYGTDPATGRTVYVGPDGHFYTYSHSGPMAPADLRSTWCPHDAGVPIPTQSRLAQFIEAFPAIFQRHVRLVDFSYVERPAGYNWKAVRAAPHGNIGYYAKDPSNGWTLYVGPDNVFYTFRHAPPITPSDLGSLWTPHNRAAP